VKGDPLSKIIRKVSSQTSKDWSRRVIDSIEIPCSELMIRMLRLGYNTGFVNNDCNFGNIMLDKEKNNCCLIDYSSVRFNPVLLNKQGIDIRSIFSDISDIF
jgi:hypothetical protein